MMSERIEFYRATGKYGFLSNLYQARMWIDGNLYLTVEHAYQVAKAADAQVKEYIQQAPTPYLAAIIGHGLYPWMIVKGWTKDKVSVMRRLLEVKFSEPTLLQKLIDTGDAELIEISKTDAFWGVGKKGTGKNMLGKMLMQIRDRHTLPEHLLQIQEAHEYSTGEMITDRGELQKLYDEYKEHRHGGK